MRLLIIAPPISSPDQVNSFGGVWSYFLPRAFRDCGIDCDILPPPIPEQALEVFSAVDLQLYDHVLALGTRYFTRVPRQAVKLVMARCRGIVAQVYDGPCPHAPCDLTFSIKAQEGERAWYVGWAADQKVFCSLQDPRMLRILVDHPDYNRGRLDLSLQLLTSLRNLISNQSPQGMASILVRQIVDGKIINSDMVTVPQFDRKHVPLPVMAEELSYTSVFLVTHRESLGQMVLEAALSGALVVVPKGFVPPDRLRTVRHIAWSGSVDWVEVIHALDPEKSREVALPNTWYAVVQNMLTAFTSYKPTRR